IIRLDTPLAEPDDAVVLVAEAELLGGADHAVAHVAVGLARGDDEAAREHGPGQADHDQVALDEVVRTAHDAARLSVGVEGLADVDAAPADGLAVLLRLVGEGQDPADDERAADV